METSTVADTQSTQFVIIILFACLLSFLLLLCSKEEVGWYWEASREQLS